MKRGPQRRLSRPGKCDFRHPKAKSACFDISFFKVKVSFFLHKNITKLRKNDANTLYFIFFSIIFVFRQGQDQQEAFFRGIFPQKAEPQDRSQQVFPSKCTSQSSLTVFPFSWQDGGLFACSLSAEVTGFIEQLRLNLVMNLLRLKLTVFILYFYMFLTSAVLIQGVQMNPLNPCQICPRQLKFFQFHN